MSIARLANATVAVQTPTITAGTLAKSWANRSGLGAVRCWMADTSSNERSQLGSTSETVQVVFRFPGTPTIQAQDRIVHDGSNYVVTSVTTPATPRGTHHTHVRAELHRGTA